MHTIKNCAPHLIKYILPNEDIEDINLIRKKIDKLERYNFEEIIEKYDLDDFVIIVFFEKKSELNVLSKVYLNKQYKILNSRFFNFDIENSDSVLSIIAQLKTSYENEWKKNNQINTSIKLPLTLQVGSKNYDLIKKLENELSNLDLVSNFFIDHFDNQITTYKIIFNGTPNRFIQEINKSEIKLNTSLKIWRVE